MSSFMCKKETMADIAYYMVGLSGQDKTTYESTFNSKVKKTYYDLVAMNTAAIYSRYGDCRDWDQMIPQDMSYPEDYDPSKVCDEQLFVEMECYLYQCEEGHIPETWLYHDVEHAMRCLTCEMLSKYIDHEWFTKYWG